MPVRMLSTIMRLLLHLTSPIVYLKVTVLCHWEFQKKIIDIHGISLLEVSSNTYDQNSGSFYISQTTVFFSNTTFTKNHGHSIEPDNNNLVEVKTGRATMSYQSKIVFRGINSLLNNVARQGGAVLAIESTITISGEVIIAKIAVEVVFIFSRVYLTSKAHVSSPVIMPC